MQIKKSQRVMFVGISDTFYRLKKMTNKEVSYNAEDESYKFVDEETAQTEVSSYAPAIGFEFNVDSEVKAQDPISEVFEKEKIGEEAVIQGCDIFLDKPYTNADLADVSANAVVAFKREYTVIPDSESGESGPLVYSGELSAKGRKIWGYATSDDDWKTCKFTEVKENVSI